MNDVDSFIFEVWTLDSYSSRILRRYQTSAPPSYSLNFAKIVQVPTSAPMSRIPPVFFELCQLLHVGKW